MVPIRIGRPVSWTSSISSTTASHFSFSVRKMRSGWLTRMQRLVGRDGDDVELVDLPELVGLGHGRAGHARELLVELEEVLQRDRRQRLRLFLDLDAVRACLASTAWCRPSDHCRPIIRRPVNSSTMMMLISLVLGMAHHHVLLVLLVEVMGLEGVVDQVRPFHVAGGVEALDAGQLLGLADALVGQVAGVFLLLDLEVLARRSCFCSSVSWTAISLALA